MNLQNLLLVGIGGFFGSSLRYFIARTVDENLNRLIPYGTLMVNVLGSLILGGIYAGISLRKPGGLSENIGLVAGVGFCGGFTTFSTFAWQSLQLLEQKNWWEAVGYITMNLVLSIVAVWAGFSFVRSL